jgi:Ser/Thr protein kinase RdoA (MazF antagonist)
LINQLTKSSVQSFMRHPSWDVIIPGLPTLRKVDHIEEDFIKDLIGLNGDFYYLDFGKGSVGMYLIRSDSGDFFVKILSKATKNDLYAEGLASWLSKKSKLAVSCIEGYPRKLKTGELLIIQPYCHGFRVSPSTSEMRKLGGSLAELHGLLASHPDRSTWQENTDRRLSQINSMRRDLAEGRIRAGPNPALLASIAADKTIIFSDSETTQTPLHGDLNPGNILIKEGNPIFIDFEDVFHSVLNPCFELALIIERCVMSQPISTEDCIAASKALLNEYQNSSGNFKLLKNMKPVNLPRSLALRSMCILALAEQEGFQVLTSEWKKFYKLYEHTNDSDVVWKKIFS